MSIATTYFKEKIGSNGEKTGSFNYVCQKPIDKVLEQVKAKLSTIKDETGASADKTCEWISAECKDVFPRGEPFAVMRYGSNEGHLVHVMSYDRSNGEIKPAITIKYLSGKEFVYQVAQELNEALYDGLFVAETIPH